jgi:hypothetical protein
MKWLTRILAALGVVYLASQGLRPEYVNRPVDPAKQLVAPPHVQSILDRSCNDCHSNHTKWPWYSKVSPISWWLVDHVGHGRRDLSFSDFKTYPQKRAAHKMEEVCEQVESGEMPLPSYLWMHPSAKLSAADKQTLCGWAKSEQARILATPEG